MAKQNDTVITNSDYKPRSKKGEGSKNTIYMTPPLKVTPKAKTRAKK